MIIKILRTFTKNNCCNIYKPISTFSMEAVSKKVKSLLIIIGAIKEQKAS